MGLPCWQICPGSAANRRPFGDCRGHVTTPEPLGEGQTQFPDNIPPLNAAVPAASV